MSAELLKHEFGEAVDSRRRDFESFVDRKILITGASGFVASWLIGMWIEAYSKHHGSGLLTLVCRNPVTIYKRFPQLTRLKGHRLVSSDIRDLRSQDVEYQDVIIHAATPASEDFNRRFPLEMVDVIVTGSRRIVDIATEVSAKKVVMMSSGAIYGSTSITTKKFVESDLDGPDITNPKNAYHEAKRTAELIGNIGAGAAPFEFVALRLFTFLAPFLPLNTHFAAGNFIRDALTGKTITIQSGGGSVRSYQYGTDLARYVVAATVNSLNHSAYNVGSSTPIRIDHLATEIRRIVNRNAVIEVRGEDTRDNLSYYVPEVSRIQSELVLNDLIDLETSIRRTATWALEAQVI